MLRLTELFESDASEKAKQMGLDYMSFGRWGKDGTVTHKSVNGALVPVDAPVEKPAPMKKTPLKKQPKAEKPAPAPAAPRSGTSEFTDKLSDTLLSALESKNIGQLVDATSKLLGRETPVKVKKPGIFAGLRAAGLKLQGKEIVGSYDMDDDSIIFYKDLSEFLSRSPSTWKGDDGEHFNVIVHESVHAASPRLKKNAHKTIKPIELALEEGITEFISQSVTKKIQLKDQQRTGRDRGFIVTASGPYDNFVNLFKFLNYGGVNIQQLFMEAKTSEELSNIADVEGRKVMDMALSKQFSETEKAKIMEKIAENISNEPGAKTGHALISKKLASVISKLIAKNVSNNKKSKINTLEDMGMERHEIVDILDKEDSV